MNENQFESGQIEMLLRRKLTGRIRELHVDVVDDGLVLQGFAPTYYAKQLAQHAAMEVSGLPIRANEIKVQ